MFRYKDHDGKRRSKRLCRADASIGEIWQAFNAITDTRANTFRSLSLDFQKSPTWAELSAATHKDYINCHNAICERKTSTGKLGDAPLHSWSPGLVRKYRDKRAEESRSRANKELSYIARVFAWGYEYEKVKSNPARGISKLKTAPRQHYVAEPDYKTAIDCAAKSGSPYMAPAMEIAYLCRMRLAEVLDLTDANELPDGLLVSRRKGSKDNITRWTPRLRAAINDAKRIRLERMNKNRHPMPIKPEQRYFFVGVHSGRLRESTFQTAWQRLMKYPAIKQKFTFHDLKRRGISDTKGDKLAASGHRDLAMLRIYDVTPDLVDPAGKE